MITCHTLNFQVPSRPERYICQWSKTKQSCRQLSLFKQSLYFTGQLFSDGVDIIKEFHIHCVNYNLLFLQWCQIY